MFFNSQTKMNNFIWNKYLGSDRKSQNFTFQQKTLFNSNLNMSESSVLKNIVFPTS